MLVCTKLSLRNIRKCSNQKTLCKQFFGTVSLFLGVYYAATIPIEQTPSEVNLIKPNTEENSEYINF